MGENGGKNMKLVAAKCPNCGSSIEVDPNNETMKCDYCRSAILIDEAIAKYKIEISGEVEIKNIPKIENYLKLAERNYSNKDYENAYEDYRKILELDSSNAIALLRYGICKTLLNNYIDFSMEYLINSFKEAQSIIKNKDNYKTDIEQFVLETSYATDESLSALRKYYNTYIINNDDLLNIQKKLFSILLCYETILEFTDNKTHIIEQIISVLKDLIKDKSYKTGSSREGENFYEIYKINNDDKFNLSKKLNYYESMLNPSLIEEKEEGLKQNSKLSKFKFPKQNVKILIILIDIFLWILIIGFISTLFLVSSLITFLIFLIITYDNISNILFNDDSDKKKNCIIILIVILFFTIGVGI